MSQHAHAPVDMPTSPRTVFTIGHSTRPLGVLIDMLTSEAVTTLVDVRTIPRSRHNPQFNRESLPAALAGSGIAYAHAEGLGGLRRALPDSTNGGWRNLSFRGYADYMQTPAFAENLFWLMRLAEDERVAIMCAEAVPWRCHRSLIADALMAHGMRVDEIADVGRVQPHRLTPFARVEGTRVTYPPYEAAGG